VSGIVITHGTDTLEETAWFLQCVLRPAKPVVLTCAMRPATAISADGPGNLRDAVACAADMQAAGRGVLAVVAGRVFSARQVRKVHPYRVDAFDGSGAGPQGWVEEGGCAGQQAGCRSLRPAPLQSLYRPQITGPRWSCCTVMQAATVP
jgi:L-asparaginase